MIKTLFKIIIAATFIHIYSPSFADSFDEGIDYKIIPSPFQTFTAKGKIEVLEIFWYGCPHCFNLEPVLESWQRPSYIEFKIIPAISARGWAKAGAQTYYTALALGIADKLHTPIFDEIHTNNNQKLISQTKEIAKFFSRNGISDSKFYDAWNSFAVDTNLKKAQKIFARSGITGVPSFVIDGKYLTSPSMAGSSKRALEIIEYLAKKSLGIVK